MKVKVIFVAVFLAGLIAGGFVTGKYISKVKDKEFLRTEKVYKYVIDKQSASYDSLAGKARYMIQQTLTVKKNKKGQIIYVPTSTMEIDKIVKNYKATVDTLNTVTPILE